MLFLLASLLVVTQACQHFEYLPVGTCNYNKTADVGGSAKAWCAKNGTMYFNQYTTTDCSGPAAAQTGYDCTSGGVDCSCVGSPCSSAEVIVATCGSGKSTTTVMDINYVLGHCVTTGASSSVMYWCDGTSLVESTYIFAECGGQEMNTKWSTGSCTNGMQVTVNSCTGSSSACQYYETFPAGKCQYDGAESYQYWCDWNDNMYWTTWTSADCSGAPTYNETTPCSNNEYCSCAGGASCDYVEIVESTCGSLGDTVYTDYSLVTNMCFDGYEYTCDATTGTVGYNFYTNGNCTGSPSTTVSYTSTGCVNDYSYEVTDCTGAGSTIQLSLALLFSIVLFWSTN